MPIAVRVSTVSFSNSVVMMAADGMPSFNLVERQRLDDRRVLADGGPLARSATLGATAGRRTGAATT
jgi:hypothetical protein